jgi:ketosteroid isomerase-like protein
MKRLIIFLLFISLIFSCGLQRMTSNQIDLEKKKIESLIIQMNNGVASKDIEVVSNTISKSDEFIGFGTDSTEAIKSYSEWKELMKNSFPQYESAKFSELRNLSIQISSTGDMASAIYEVQAEYVCADHSSFILYRFANTWRKENGEWKVIHWLASLAL